MLSGRIPPQKPRSSVSGPRLKLRIERAGERPVRQIDEQVVATITRVHGNLVDAGAEDIAADASRLIRGRDSVDDSQNVAKARVVERQPEIVVGGRAGQ